jgi:formylglycine-generating enzyme
MDVSGICRRKPASAPPGAAWRSCILAPHDADASDSDVRDSGLDAQDAADGDDPYDGCPTDVGTTMVRIDVPDASFCIDVTEVTVGQFTAYLATHPTLGSTVPPACTADAAVGDQPGTPDPAPPRDNPATDLNFCYAWDYCAAVGKRLCGALGGGPVNTLQPAASEWYYACTNGPAATAYPYGNDYDAAACVTDALGPDLVGTHPACRGIAPPFSLIFDMSGNVAEFDNSATSYDGSDGVPGVFPRGGTYASFGGGGFSCMEEGSVYMYTNATQDPPEFGFRCCADVR